MKPNSKTSILRALLNEFERAGSVFIYRCTFEEKWGGFINKKIDRCLAKAPVVKINNKDKREYF